MSKLKFNIESEGFDAYFNHESEKMNEQTRAVLPKEMLFKMFKSRKGILNENYTNKLGFIARLFVLFKALRKKWFIVVTDESGISVDDFCELLKSKEKETSIPTATKLVSSGAFVLADKDLSHSFAHLNTVGVSGAYKWAIKGKNTKTDYADYREAASYMVQLLMNYEAQKKKIVMQRNLSMPELYMMYYFYDGEQKKGSEGYSNVFKYAYNASRSQMITALTSLHSRGYLEKSSSKRFTTYKITALGISVLNDVFDKFIFNF